MNKIFSIAVFLLIVFGISCKKSQPSGPAPEASIVFTTDANATNTSVLSSFPVTVTLTSKMPSSSGINIEAKVIDQTNNAPLTQNQGINSTNAFNKIQLINLERQHWCTVTIKVTSVATPTNTASKTFEVVYK